MNSAVGISPKLPIISLSNRQKEGSLETHLNHTKISLSQWAVSAPIMLAFKIMCYYLLLPFNLQRIKHWGSQDSHNKSVHLPVIGQTKLPCFNYIGNLSVVWVWRDMSMHACKIVSGSANLSFNYYLQMLLVYIKDHEWVYTWTLNFSEESSKRKAPLDS